MKKVCAFILCILMSLGCTSVVFAAVDNPFQIIGTDVEDGAEEFVVSVQLKESLTLSAYEISVHYDTNMLEVVDQEGTGYFYTEEFKNYYSGGLFVCNDKDNSEVVFAGSKTGAAGFQGTVAKIRFKVKKQAGSATTIKLQIKAVGQEDTQGVTKLDITNPEIEYRIVLKEFKGMAGDINSDNKVGLDDAQLALKAALKIVALDSNQTLAADVNQDGIVNLVDAQTILKKALKIIP